MEELNVCSGVDSPFGGAKGKRIEVNFIPTCQFWLRSDITCHKAPSQMPPLALSLLLLAFTASRCTHQPLVFSSNRGLLEGRVDTSLVHHRTPVLAHVCHLEWMSEGMNQSISQSMDDDNSELSARGLLGGSHTGLR